MVIACVTVISAPLGKLPIRLVRRLDNGGSVVARDHPLPALLRKPNTWQTQLEFRNMMRF
jgi:phage portal protein BeeE